MTVTDEQWRHYQEVAAQEHERLHALRVVLDLVGSTGAHRAADALVVLGATRSEITTAVSLDRTEAPDQRSDSDRTRHRRSASGSSRVPAMNGRGGPPPSTGASPLIVAGRWGV